MKLTGIVLCGGKSKRMGQNKALLKLGNFTLIEHVIKTLSLVCDEIILSVNDESLDILPYRKVKDEISNIGPIAGFYSTLSKSASENNLVVSCDNPFINKMFLDLLINESNGFEIVLPVYKNKIQTTTGFFKKSIIPNIKAQIDKGNYVPVNIFENYNSRMLAITDENCPGADKIFMNINCHEDFENAQKIYNEFPKH
jgi:molybdenum cofactor guanylyltransferase